MILSSQLILLEFERSVERRAPVSHLSIRLSVCPSISTVHLMHRDAPVSRPGAAPAHSSLLSPVLASAATLFTRYWRDGPPDAAYLLSWKPREMQQTACTTNNGILPARYLRLFTSYFHADKFAVFFSCVWANSHFKTMLFVGKQPRLGPLAILYGTYSKFCGCYLKCYTFACTQ